MFRSYLFVYFHISSINCSNKSTRNERLTVLHAISKQAIEEERSRRLALLRLHDSDENRIVSSIQYQDLLNMDLNMFHSPHPTPEPGVMTPVNSHTHFDFSVSPIQSNPNSPQRDNNQTLQSESFHSGPHNEFETLPPSPPHSPPPRFNSYFSLYSLFIIELMKYRFLQIMILVLQLLYVLVIKQILEMIDLLNVFLS